MNDTISRQDAIDGLYEMASDIDHLCTVKDYVDFLESLPAQPKWISVTEKLPKPNETIGRVLKHYLVQDIYGDMLVGIWDGVNWQMSCSIEVIDDVVAWMPLPKPYKEGE